MCWLIETIQLSVDLIQPIGFSIPNILSLGRKIRPIKCLFLGILHDLTLSNKKVNDKTLNLVFCL